MPIGIQVVSAQPDKKIDPSNVNIQWTLYQLEPQQRPQRDVDQRVGPARVRSCVCRWYHLHRELQPLGLCHRRQQWLRRGEPHHGILNNGTSNVANVRVISIANVSNGFTYTGPFTLPTVDTNGVSQYQVTISVP